MSIEIDGWTMLFYDKYAGTHNFNNNFTKCVKMEDLFGSDNITITGKDAIEEFNKFGETYTIHEQIDENLYQINMFMTTYGNNDNNVAKYMIIGINNKLLKQ